MSGILATFSRLKNGGGGGGPPLVANRYSPSYTLYTPSSGILGYDIIGPVGVITPSTDYAYFNDIERFREGTLGSEFLELKLSSLATDPRMFEWINLNGMILNYNQLSVFVYPPGFTGADLEPVPIWRWGDGDNGFALTTPLAYDSNYPFTINAWLMNSTAEFTIGSVGAAPNRTIGYNMNGAYGFLGAWTDDAIYTIRYYEPLNRTEIYGVDDGLGNQIFKYYGPTLTARYNGVDTIFTSALYIGAPTYPFDNATLYVAPGDPFNMIGNAGLSRTVQVVSNG